MNERMNEYRGLYYVHHTVKLYMKTMQTN